MENIYKYIYRCLYRKTCEKYNFHKRPFFMERRYVKVCGALIELVSELVHCEIPEVGRACPLLHILYIYYMLYITY